MDGMNEHPQFEDTGQIDPTIRDRDIDLLPEDEQYVRPGNMVRSEHPPKPDPPDVSSEHPDCRTCRRRIDKGNRTKDAAISVACFAFGLLAITAVVICVIFTCKALMEPKQAIDPNAYVQRVGLDPENVTVYYDNTGKMHLNVYVHQMPDVDINVIIDKDGNATVTTVDKDNAQPTTVPSVTPEPTQTTEPSTTPEPTITDTPEPTITPEPTEEVKPTDTPEPTEEITPTPTEKPDDPEEPGDVVDKPSDQDTEKMTEDDYLKAQQERIANGEGRYSDSDTKYMIVWGDTLCKLSRQTGYSVEFLAKYNNISNPDLIYAGDPLYYPSK